MKALKTILTTPYSSGRRTFMKDIRAIFKSRYGVTLDATNEELAIALEDLGYKVNRKTWKTDARIILMRSCG